MGMSVGVTLTFRGSVHVWPPLLDDDSTIPSAWPRLKRASCHTRYSRPLAGSTARSVSRLPAATGSPVSGSVVPTERSRSTIVAGDQLRPLLLEPMTATLDWAS